MSECAVKCRMCDKRGLPILVTRYAIAPDDAGAPVVNGQFAVTDTCGKAIPLGGKAIYTQRLLRSGYLYVFDEAVNKWQGYFVTSLSDLMPFDIPEKGPTGSAITGDPAKISPCNREKNGEVAGCISITSPKLECKSRTIWLGFSDVEWTNEVWTRHQEASYRERHMRSFDVKQWMTSTTHKHAGGIYKHTDNIAEYAPKTNYKSFQFSPAPFVDRKSRSKALIKAFENLQPGKGVVLAINDPVGITSDLASLMSYRFTEFSDSAKHLRPLAISSAIQSLKASTEHQAELEELAAAERHKNELVGNSYGSILWTESGRKIYEAADDVTPAQLDSARKHAWKKYNEKYSETKRANFQKYFDQALQEFDNEQIAPLAQAHAVWMKSQRLANCFECNFDEKSPDNGIVYTSTLSLCIAATQDKKVCFDVYADWLGGSLTDKKNLLLRGLLLNQESFAKTISDGTKVSVDPRGLPWDGMIGNVGKSIDSILENQADIVGRFMTQVSGPMMRVLKNLSESGALPEALVAAGVISKAPILRIEFSGTMKDFQKHVVQELMKARGEPVAAHGFKTAVDREIRLMEIKGAKLDGTRKKKFLVLADLDSLKAVPAGGKQTDRARALAKSLANVDDLEKIELSRWRTTLGKGVARGKMVVPFAFSALGALLQWVALGKLSEDLDKSNKTGKDKDENSWRYGAGWAAFGGTLVEMLGNTLAKFPALTLRFGQGVSRLLPKVLQIAGKSLGVLGAGIVAFWDVTHAKDEFSKGNTGLGFVYLASAILGVGGAIVMLCTFATATGIGLLLVLLAIGISVLIEFIKDNPLQEWLEGSFFGKNTFISLESEMKALRKVGA